MEREDRGFETPSRIRTYDPEKDRQAAARIWRETGWIEPEEEREEEALSVFLSGADAYVAELDGSPECLVSTMPGTVRYLSRDLRMRAVTTVTTSRVGRRQGLASRLTARALAEGARAGDVAAFLGIFDQGFYDRLGFGSGAYERRITIDPAALTVEGRPTPPQRITSEEAAAVHRARVDRLRYHGGCSILPQEFTAAVMAWSKKGFGLGYRDEEGRITHHLWAIAKGENGPYDIQWLSYETPEQFLELLTLVKGLGDQIYAVRLGEPGWVRMQDLLEQPFRRHTVSKHSEMESSFESYAYWQVRILDIEKAMAVTSLPGRGEISFNLLLEDPVARYLQDSDGWRGTGGEYVVTVGEVSHARRGTDKSLPTLRASVNAFSRLWLGVAPAASIALTDDLEAPPELLDELSWKLCLPTPSLDWVF